MFQIKEMFSWVHCFRKGHVSDDDSPSEGDEAFGSKFSGQEQNVVLVANKKDKESVTRFVRSISNLFPSGGVHFTNEGLSYVGKLNRLKEQSYSIENVGSTLLTQKAALESYDAPPSLIIFDACPVASDQFFAEIVSTNEKLRYTSITIVSDVSELNKHLLSKMNAIVFFKERNKVKLSSRNRSIWEKRFKNRITFEQFHCCVVDGTGAMKASMISDEGMYVLKLGKTGVNMINVCAFKPDVQVDEETDMSAGQKDDENGEINNHIDIIEVHDIKTVEV